MFPELPELKMDPMGKLTIDPRDPSMASLYK